MAAAAFSVGDRTGPSLVGVNASAPISHVSVGSASSDRTALKGIPFSACCCLWLEPLCGALLIGDGEGLGDRLRLPARKPSARFENMVTLGDEFAVPATSRCMLV